MFYIDLTILERDRMSRQNNVLYNQIINICSKDTVRNYSADRMFQKKNAQLRSVISKT